MTDFETFWSHYPRKESPRAAERENDRERRRAYQQAWALKNPEKCAAARARHRAKHRERINAERRAQWKSDKGWAERQMAWAKNNPKKVSGYKRKWKLNNKDKRKAGLERWKRRHPDKDALGRLRRALGRYNLTVEQYEAMLASQGGGCAICLARVANSRGHRLFVDHDHTTGQVRGLLCSRCNSSIGYFDEQPIRLRRAAAYIERWQTIAEQRDRSELRSLLESLSEAPSEAGRAESLDATEPKQ